jgi:S1-C subfamily serine protease
MSLHHQLAKEREADLQRAADAALLERRPQRPRRRHGVLAGVALTTALALGACGGSDEQTPAVMKAPAPKPAAAPTPPTPAQLHEKAKRSVVRISTKGYGGARGGGSGVVIGDGSLVLTNRHVLADASSFRVHHGDESVHGHEIAYASCTSDLSVIKLKDKLENAQPLTPGDAGTLKAGDRLMAFGHGAQTARGRQSKSVLMTEGLVSGDTTKANSPNLPPIDLMPMDDMSMRPGYSGGAVFDANGNWVGVPVVGADDERYALPIDEAFRRLVQELSVGKQTEPSLGMNLVSLTKEELSDYFGFRWPRGALAVMDVDEDGGAARAKPHRFEPGDVVLEIDGQKVRTLSDACDIVTSNTAGDTLRITAVNMSRYSIDTMRVKLR